MPDKSALTANSLLFIFVVTTSLQSPLVTVHVKLLGPGFKLITVALYKVASSAGLIPAVLGAPIVHIPVSSASGSVAFRFAVVPQTS